MRVVGPDGGSVQTIQGAPQTADIVVGTLSHTVTTGAAALLTVAAGRTWRGSVTVSVAISKAGAASGNGEAIGVIATAGAGVTPAAGTILTCRAYAGANVVAGTAGSQGNNGVTSEVVVVAPAGNSVTLTLATTINNATDAAVDASAIGTYV